jgi:alkylmercury lyase
MTQIEPIRVVDIAEQLHAGFGELSDLERPVAVALYRSLARGEPVASAALAGELGLAESAMDELLEGWPGVFRSDEGGVIGFWGLALPEMPHRFEVRGQQLHTWCAWDSLFIPGILGQTARVESRCKESGDPVSLIVDPDGVRSANPANIVVSLLDAEDLELNDIVGSFCHAIHFFRSPEDGAAWSARHAGTFIVSLDQAFEIGRHLNRIRYGDALRDGYGRPAEEEE